MSLLRNIIIISLLLTICKTSPLQVHDAEINQAVNDDIKFRLLNNTVPIHYTIELILNITKNNTVFDGSTSIVFEVRKSTKKFFLHAVNLIFDEEYTKIENNNNFTKPLKHYYHPIFGLLQLSFEKTLEPSIYTIHFKYKGKVNLIREGLFQIFYTDDNRNEVPITVTHFESTHARRVFPCWDEIGLKTTFNLSVKHDANYTALSNMPAYEKVIDETDGKIWTKFKTTPRMSTYVLAFVVFDFVRTSNENETINVWCRRNAVDNIFDIFNVIQQGTSVLEQYMNRSIAVPKTDHIAIPGYPSKATEHWGLIAYNERTLLFNKSKDNAELKLGNALTATHELIHQWFGNLVTPVWWTHLWLSESVSAYFQFYFVDKIYPEWRVMDYFLVTVQLLLLRIDNYSIHPIATKADNQFEIDRLFSLVVYRKGPCILQMLHNAITDEVFHNGILRYLDKHEYNSTTSDDLWEALQSSLDSANIIHNDLNIKEAMDPWIYQSGYPMITVRRDYNNGNLIVTQQLYLSNLNSSFIFEPYDSKEFHEYKWSIPINYATQSHQDFTNTFASHWLKPEDDNLVIYNVDPSDWIIINLQSTGYYRVNYDQINWRRIAKYMKLNNHTNIHFKNRAMLINDAFAMAMQGQSDFYTFLEMVSYLPKEDNLVVWSALTTDILDYLIFGFKLPTTGKQLKHYFLSLMNNIIKKVESADDDALCAEDISTKEHILKWACYLGHQKCRSTAAAEVLQYLNNDETDITDERSKKYVFCSGIISGNETVWYKIWDLYEKHLDEDYLFFLACTENKTLIDYLMRKALDDYSSQMLKGDIRDIFDSLAKSDIDHSQSVLTFLERNIDILVEKKLNWRGILMNVMDNAVDTNHLNKIKEIFARADKNETLINERVIEIEAKLAKRNPMIIDMKKWLKNNNYEKL
ncbi:aminopeptidase N-like [Prorops nasuta]|uniref:aminopeptidase N-like n=1 Tax=Prorops nasuta TaxID=863751 RepID=UPI0034CFEA1A